MNSLHPSLVESRILEDELIRDDTGAFYTSINYWL